MFLKSLAATCRQPIAVKREVGARSGRYLTSYEAVAHPRAVQGGFERRYSPGRPNLQRLDVATITMYIWWVILVLLLITGLGGCAANGTAQPLQPTPTALPPAPVLERPTYTVERGPIERALEATGRVVPVESDWLAFQVDGRVAEVIVARGDIVKVGDVLAELLQEEVLVELRRAEAQLSQAERDLELAAARQDLAVRRAESRLRQAKRAGGSAAADLDATVREAELALQRAEADLARLLPGGADDQQRAAAAALADAERANKETKDAASEAKTRTENALIEATEALQNAQDAYSDAYWDVEWVRKYGTDPNVELEEPSTGRRYHPDLTQAQAEAYGEAFVRAEQELRAAERALELALRDVDLAREAEVVEGQRADRELALARETAERLSRGEDTPELLAARRTVEDARLTLELARVASTDPQAAVEEAALALEEARLNDLGAEEAAADDARLELELAQQRADAGRIIAPRDGQVIEMNIRAGDEASAFERVIEVADSSQLEVEAELSSEDQRELAEGQPAEISLVVRPDIRMPALIRRLPTSATSQLVDDRSTRFSVIDLRGQTLTAGSVVRVYVVLERVESALLLPPEAIRAYEGRRFVVVRRDGVEIRAPIRIGIETEIRVEILEGLEEGDVVVGQ